MDNIQAASHRTNLKDRVLWYDGKSTFDAGKALEYVKRYGNIEYVDVITPIISEYNKHVIKSKEIRTKLSCEQLCTEWNIPDEYKQMDVIDYIMTKHSAMPIPEEERSARELRIAQELVQYNRHGFSDVLRVIIFIINTLLERNCVYGVGRGSSVSSYILYIIGVHDVDSFAYDLDIHDFLHE